MILKRRKTDRGFLYIFWCPGCNTEHNFDVREDQWTFDGDWEKPTFSPSLALPKCHLFVRNGVIEYLHDCKHRLAGKDVPMQHIPGTE
jgi:hypothetical protein